MKKKVCIATIGHVSHDKGSLFFDLARHAEENGFIVESPQSVFEIHGRGEPFDFPAHDLGEKKARRKGQRRARGSF